MTDAPTQQFEVDLSDDATLEEMDADTDDAPPDPHTPKPESKSEPQARTGASAGGDGNGVSPALREEAKQEAIRLRENADGDSQAEKVRNAYQQATDSFERNSKQLRQLRQQHQQAEDRIERLEMTKERVKDQPPDVPILQTLAGGISLEVPTDEYEPEDDVYTRSDLVGEIDETIEALGEQVDDLGGQVDGLEEALTKTQLAAQQLKEVQDVIGD